MPRSNSILTLLAVLLLDACAAISTEQKARLSAAPDCAQAEAQIAALQKDKPSDLARLRVTSEYVAPPGWIGGLIHKDWKDRAAVVNGDYERQIDQKVAEIRTTCHLPQPDTSDKP